MNYLKENELLGNDQHGFKKGRTTITAGINFVSSIIKSIKRDKKAVRICLHVTQVLDSVCHVKLHNKLDAVYIKRSKHK